MPPRSKGRQGPYRKFRNTKTVLLPDGALVPHDAKAPRQGLLFDSKKEARRWLELVQLQRSGAIQSLERQKIIRIKVNGVKVCSYVADFQYLERGRMVVEDCKSPITARLPVYVLKKKLLAAALGIEIRESI